MAIEASPPSYWTEEEQALVRKPVSSLTEGEVRQRWDIAFRLMRELDAKIMQRTGGKGIPEEDLAEVLDTLRDRWAE